MPLRILLNAKEYTYSGWPTIGMVIGLIPVLEATWEAYGTVAQFSNDLLLHHCGRSLYCIQHIYKALFPYGWRVHDGLGLVF